MIKLIENFKTISIIGMAKNVGKTTTLNYILKHMYSKKKIGITSIGRDGEEVDLVTNTAKPRIYIEKGTIVATTTECLSRSDFTKKILEVTSLQTSLGAVIICEALSDGFVDLAGPSINSQIKYIIERFQALGVDLSIIDGAISRKGFANPFLCDGTILCTGASYSSDVSKLVTDTKHFVDLFHLKEIKNNNIRNLFDETKISIVNQNNKTTQLNVKTAMDSAKEIVQALNQDSQFLLIKGALSNQLLETLIDNRNLFKKLTVVVQDPTKCIYDSQLNEKLQLSHIDIKVINSSRLLAVTYNPTSPYGYHFDDLELESLLKRQIKIPILNVMRDEHE